MIPAKFNNSFDNALLNNTIFKYIKNRLRFPSVNARPEYNNTSPRPFVTFSQQTPNVSTSANNNNNQTRQNVCSINVSLYVQLRLSQFGIIGCPNHLGRNDKFFPSKKHQQKRPKRNDDDDNKMHRAHILTQIDFYSSLLFVVRQIRCVSSSCDV